MRYGGGAVEIEFDLFLATIHVPLHHLKHNEPDRPLDFFIFMIFAFGDWSRPPATVNFQLHKRGSGFRILLPLYISDVIVFYLVMILL